MEKSVLNPLTLVVDLDNSLLKVDLFKEALCKSLYQKPWIFIKTVFLAMSNRAKAKTYISKNIKIDCQILPYNQEVISIMQNYRDNGYQLILATGAPEVYASAIANHLGFFDNVISTVDKVNNIGNNKLRLIKEKVTGEFIYIGDSIKDLPIWVHCKKAIIIGNSISIKKILKSNSVEIVDVIKNKKYFRKIVFRQLRVHQWSKNILLFIPALASHQLLSLDVFINTLHGFLAFSLLASSIYVMNDIIDIDHDRSHPTKNRRPIAAGDLSLFSASGLLILCFMGGAVLACYLGSIFFFIAGIYIILNLFYSLKLKKVIILDVILLMAFYSIRLLAGHALDSIPVSPWLLAFTIFLFFSLALLKRYVDIIIMQRSKISNTSFLSGRGYQINDSNMIMSLGVGSGLISSLVLILYVGSDQVQKLYSTPMMLVALVPVMLYWISRMWLMAERGEIKSDPVLFALKDFNSYLVVFCTFLIMYFAKILIL